MYFFECNITFYLEEGGNSYFRQKKHHTSYNLTNYKKGGKVLGLARAIIDLDDSSKDKSSTELYMY